MKKKANFYKNIISKDWWLQVKKLKSFSKRKNQK
jgi:hypothetical protein